MRTSTGTGRSTIISMTWTSSGSTSLGMWTFLATEIMMFGGLFFAYSLYRSLYEKAFVTGSSHLNIQLGTINTFVLLFSSLTVALAVHAAQTNNRKKLVTMLIITWVFGAAFLGIKAVEWIHDYHEGLIPGVSWNPAKAVEGAENQANPGGNIDRDSGAPPPQGQALRPEGMSPGTTGGSALDPSDLPGAKGDAMSRGSIGYDAGGTITGDSPNSYDTVFSNQVKMYFVIYFCMTGLHAIHMIVGLLLVGYFIFTGARGLYLNGNDQPVEIMGLYWHLIDIIWIFLFPLLYLIPGFHPFAGGH
jgi:cytochrome c oxidase subunit III